MYFKQILLPMTNSPSKLYQPTMNGEKTTARMQSGSKGRVFIPKIQEEFGPKKFIKP